VFTSPVAPTAKRPATQPNPTGSNPTFSCSCSIFNIKNRKKPQSCNRVATGCNRFLVGSDQIYFLIKTSPRTAQTVKKWASYDQYKYFTNGLMPFSQLFQPYQVTPV
jgi:hypothetical protein